MCSIIRLVDTSAQRYEFFLIFVSNYIYDYGTKFFAQEFVEQRRQSRTASRPSFFGLSLHQPVVISRRNADFSEHGPELYPMGSQIRRMHHDHDDIHEEIRCRESGST